MIFIKNYTKNYFPSPEILDRLLSPYFLNMLLADDLIKSCDFTEFKKEIFPRKENEAFMFDYAPSPRDRYLMNFAVTSKYMEYMPCLRWALSCVTRNLSEEDILVSPTVKFDAERTFSKIQFSNLDSDYMLLAYYICLHFSRHDLSELKVNIFLQLDLSQT